MERENRVDKCDQLVENLTASDDHDLTCRLHPLSFSTFTLCRPLDAEHDDEVTLWPYDREVVETVGFASARTVDWSS